jgi:hypothetical protein
MARSKPQSAKDAALAAIGQEWDKWSKDHGVATNEASGHDAFAFFSYLRQQRADRLNFRPAGDKWPVVHAYLLRTKRVKVEAALGMTGKVNAWPTFKPTSDNPGDCGPRSPVLLLRASSALATRSRHTCGPSSPTAMNLHKLDQGNRCLVCGTVLRLERCPSCDGTGKRWKILTCKSCRRGDSNRRANALTKGGLGRAPSQGATPHADHDRAVRLPPWILFNDVAVSVRPGRIAARPARCERLIGVVLKKRVSALSAVSSPT